LPLEGDTQKTSYRIYFHAIRDFLSQNEFKSFLSSLSQKLGKEIRLKEVSEIIVRTEKHGLLYHPASVETILQEGKAKFCLNAAISNIGRNWLEEEYRALQKLHTKFDLPYLPRVYCFSDLNATSFLLEDWFEGYHEFHISKDNEGMQRLKLWDFDCGYTYLSPEQSFEIYKQASKILTLYYDLSDFSQIFPWHHAGGDFVAKVMEEAIDVRLTTARRYEPFIDFVDEHTLNPILALCYYLLNLTIRMRLDKVDGLGKAVWADDTCVKATFKGFFEALRLKGELKRYLGHADDFLSLLQSFSQEELKTIINPLIDHYRGTGDFPLIIKNLDNHVGLLKTTLQNLPL
jgi:hypothetical protein